LNALIAPSMRRFRSSKLPLMIFSSASRSGS
jgi:hypothetical protein